MSDYQYTIEDNTVQVVGHEHEMLVCDMSSWEPEKTNRYRTLLAHKKDMEYAQAYLNQMFLKTDTTLIDGALINAAIQLLVKCFSNPSQKGRRKLDSKKVFRSFAKRIGEDDLTSQFDQFYRARNKVLSHDEHDFKENIVGLVVDQRTGAAVDMAEITIRTHYLFAENQKLLLRLVSIVLAYLDDQMETLKALLITDFNSERDKPELRSIICENVPISTAW